MRRIVLVVALALPVSVGCSSKPSACTAATTTTTVDISGTAFTPACVSTGTGATLTIVNHDTTPHTFTVKGSDIDVKLDGSATEQASLAGLAAGTYSVVCMYHPQMTETLQIT